MNESIKAEKRLAAEAAAGLVEAGMRVGLGTGSTVAQLLPALAARGLEISCVPTSPATEVAARTLGLRLEPFEQIDRLDLAIDGCDQVSPEGWLVKGAGGAHTREKVVAAAADRFLVIADSSKLVKRIAAPIPLELHRFGLAATLRELGAVELREAEATPDGGVLASYIGEVENPVVLAMRLAAVPGVVEHGLFAPALVSEVLIGRGGRVDRLQLTSGN